MMFSAGGFVGCKMNTSLPRTFSSMRTEISPSANRPRFTRHSSMPRLSRDLLRERPVGGAGQQLEAVTRYC